MSDTVDRQRPIYSFLPWVRQGITARLAGSERRATVVNGRLAWTVRLAVNGDAARPVDAPVHFYGPGDVTGIDPREVVRTDPPPLTADFEPGYFPSIEFDRPDFAWLFTPAAPERNVLTPWLCLVVVAKNAPTRLDAAAPLPVLTCARRELPDLAAAADWAHAQVAWTPGRTGTSPPTAADVARVLEGEPEKAVCRIVSTRRLAEHQAYYACLVPTYEPGRKTGLGEPLTAADEAALRPAWTMAGSADALIRLPVYYHWEFATGAGNSFEELVRRLQPMTPAAPGTARIGTMTMDLRDAGWTAWELPPMPAGESVMTFEGVLRAGGAPAPDAPAAARTALTTLLAKSPAEAGIQVVRPPLYGGLQASRDRLPDDRPWMREMNTHPAYRVAAGLGALVVRYQQEQLMAAAWEQAAAQEQAVQARAQQELAAGVNGAFADRLAQFTAEEVAQVSAPVHQQLPAGGGTVADGVQESTLPAAALSTSFRALARPEGPVARRLRAAHRATAPATDDTLVGALADQSVPEAGRMFSATAVRATVLEQLRPDAPPLPPAEEVAIPSYPQPTYELLRDYFPELFLPGLEHVAPNTVALLEPNRAVVEAYLAGLNHEMSRELLWREFPGDINATFFRRFWETPVGTTADVRPMREWTGPLGSHGTGAAAQAGLVVLLRSDLLRRFPGATIYMVKAIRTPQGQPALPSSNEQILEPTFRGTRAPDVAFLGFSLSDAQARGADGSAGYFIVIQEQPTQSRFGWPPGMAAATTPLGAAALAHHTLRRAFRVAIHASAILPPGAPRS